MLWAFRQLLVPCNYLRIQHGDSFFQSKAVYDVVLPVVLAGATAGVCLWLAIPLKVDHHAGLVDSLSQLLALMIGFYLAALAAVATFDRDGIDAPLKGGDAILWVRHHDGGHKVRKVLSYRQFIAYMFGYLSFLSLNLFIAIIFFSKVWPKISKALSPLKYWNDAERYVIGPLIFFFVFFFLWQLVITSMLAIYFLAERLQTLSDEEN